MQVFLLAAVVFFQAQILFSTSEEVGVCDQPWNKVFENAANGTVLAGDIEDLKDAVRRGARVKFVFINSAGREYAAETDNAYILNNVVCFQALMHISVKPSNVEFQNDAYWWFLSLCTSGHAHMTRYLVGAATFKGSSRDRFRTSWFVKDFGCTTPEPVLTHDKNGAILNGSIASLAWAVRNGKDIRGVTDSKYAFTMDNVDVADDNSLVGGQKIWAVSWSAVNDRLEFQNNAYWWFTMLSTNGFRDMSRWTVGSHQSRGHNNDKVSMDWFADPCWTHVLTHSEDGVEIDGSRDSLIGAIKSGHRFRIVRGQYALEVDNIHVRNGHVSAQVLDHVSKASISSFQNNAYWYWQLVHTTGHELTYRYNVGSDTNRGPSETRMGVSWYMDTRRWKKILTTNGAGTATFGSKADLRQAVIDGASVRLAVEFESGDELYSGKADAVWLLPGGDVAAQHLKHISQVPEGMHEFKLETNPYWVFMLFTTQGTVDKSQWTVGKHEARGHVKTTVFKIDWFVNY